MSDVISLRYPKHVTISLARISLHLGAGGDKDDSREGDRRTTP